MDKKDTTHGSTEFYLNTYSNKATFYGIEKMCHTDT